MPPLPNTRSIPRGMPEHFARTVLGEMTARVRCRPPDLVAARNTTTAKTGFTAAAVYYDGEARVQSHGGSGPTPAPSDRQVASAGYLVAVPHTVTQAVPGHLVEVYECDDDPSMVGLVLVVVDVPTATIILQRNLSCNRHQGVRAGT